MKLCCEPFEKTIEDLATLTLKNKDQLISLIGPINKVEIKYKNNIISEKQD